VLDVQPKFGARVRLLTTGNISKYDPDDARSVAVAAVRSATCRGDPGRRSCRRRFHAALCELVPGGVAKEISAAQAITVWARRHRDLSRSRNQVTRRILEQITPSGAVARPGPDWPASSWRTCATWTLRCASKKKLTAAVRASGTTVTGVFTVGPVVAATVIGDITAITRFPSRDHFAGCNGTAPFEVSSGNRKARRLSPRGNRRASHAPHDRDHRSPRGVAAI
jgi:hypothetical protein